MAIILRYYLPQEKQPNFPGKFGEDLVKRLLEGRRWTILAQNHRGIGYEVDLVAGKGDTVVAVEVKTRRWPPDRIIFAELITHAKFLRIEKGLARFVGKNELYPQTMRIDFAYVYLRIPEVTVYYYVDVGH
jgi:Holliday junction resolvase-like predicted endonuclease